MLDFIQKKFSTKIQIAIFLPLFIICASFGTYMINRIEQEYFQMYDVRGESLSKLLSKISTIPVLTHDYWSLEEYIQEIITDDDIAFAVVLDTKGRPLTQASKRPADTTLPKYRIYSSPIIHNENVVGQVQLGISQHAYKEGQYKDRAFFFTITAIAVLFCLVLGYFIASLITSPLKKMAATMRQVEGGDFTVRQEVEGRDEIGSLALGFNKMIDQIEKRDRQLLQFQTTLEDQVAQRTSELDKANESLHNELDNRIQMENALRRSNKFNQTVLNSMPDSVCIIDVEDYSIVAVNKIFQEHYSATKEFIIGKNCHKIIHNSTAACEISEHPCPIPQLLETGKPVTVEHIYDYKGEQEYDEITLAPIRDDSGRIVQAIHVSRDITTRKMAEVEITKARHQAELANTMKSEFLANMSHEIRTPMNSILNMTRLALDMEIPAKAKEFLSMAYSSGQLLLTIINEILDFSKIEAGKMELEEITFQLHSVLESVMDLLYEKAAAQRIELLTVVDEDIPDTLRGDPLRLGQVLNNLVNNALKFTESGEVVIRVQHGGAEDGRTKLLFAVEDTGIGLPPGFTDKIFTPFEQADGSITRKFGGTGLGLAICQRLLALMDGEISAKNRDGGGTVFHFTAYFKNAPGSEEKQEVIPLDLRGLNVLLTCENEATREILTTKLSSLSFKVQALDSHEKAIAALAAASDSPSPFQILVMDWQPDGTDPMKCLEESQNAWKSHGEVPVIVMSFITSEFDYERATAAGVGALLSKPLKDSTLFDAIIDVFGQSFSKGRQLAEKFHLRKVESLTGSTILLVEDNLMNQRVAVELLKGAGIKDIHVADNGKEALRILTDAPSFDAVLMDIQMPVMDGYEATRRIRQDKNLKGIPIIAMTAHALSGAREQCLARGMNDYVGKPIDPNELYAVLSKWVGPKQPGRTLEQKEQPAESAGQAEPLPESLPGINLQALEERFQDRGFYKNLLRDFAVHYAQAAQEIRDLTEAGKDTEAAMLVHTLKGLAGNICADQLHAALAACEAAMKEPPQEKTARIDEVEKLLAQIVESAALLQKNDSHHNEEPKEKSDTGLTAEQLSLLEKFASTLAGNDMQAEHYLAEVKSFAAFAREHRLQQIEDRMNRFQYKEALQTLRDLAASLDIVLPGG